MTGAMAAFTHAQYTINFMPVSIYLFTSSDIDECLDDPPCHADGECVDIYGGFYCRCDSGYFGDGVENCTGTV